jgi:carboxylate-amine ligase
MEFAGHAEPTLGCEWELQLVNSADCSLADGILALMPAYERNELIKPEFFQCCVELTTTPSRGAGDIETQLSKMLVDVASHAMPFSMHVAGAGTHPFDRKPAVITPSTRNLRMLGAHGVMPVYPVTFATHVHVACVDGDAAMRAMRRLTPCLPTLLAIGANSPIWHGVDTGCVSFRQRLLASNPTYGLPPYFDSWADFNRMLDAALQSGTVDNFRGLHWDLRPHGDIGTLELRVFDAQIDARRVAQLAALTRAMVVLAADPGSDDALFMPRLPHWMELENHFRASRSGLAAELIVTRHGETANALSIAERWFPALRPVAARHGDEALLEALHATLLTGNGAERQLAVWRQHRSAVEVAKFLVRATSSTADDAGRPGWRP